MGLFDRWKHPERKYAPIVYYKEDRIMGKAADQKDFPLELAEVMILMTQRLNEAGLYLEEEILRFSIPKMVEVLEQKGVLKGIGPLKEFDTAQVVFGKNYAGWWHKENQGESSALYLLPRQLAFFHSENPSHYFLCLVDKQMDMRQNKISKNDEQSIEKRIKETGTMNLGVRAKAELKTAFYMLFVHLKYQSLIQMERIGYGKFVENMAQQFCSIDQRDYWKSYAKQYFALNTEKKEQFPLAYGQNSLPEFFRKLLIQENIGISLGGISIFQLKNWVKNRVDFLIQDSKVYGNTVDLVIDLNREISPKGYRLWIWQMDDAWDNSVLLLGSGGSESPLEMGNFAVKEVSQELYTIYEKDIAQEEKIRGIAEDFYRAIGVTDIAKSMNKMHNGAVLNPLLYEENDLCTLDWEEETEDILFGADEMFKNRGLEHLIRDGYVGGLSLDEAYFEEDEDVTPYDRMMLYAPRICQKGKALFYLNTGSDSYDFGVIEDTRENKQDFHAAAKQLMELGEITGYTLFDQTQQPLFLQLLSDIQWVFNAQELKSQREVEEKAYRENQGRLEKKRLESYLNRISIWQTLIKIGFQDPDTDQYDYQIIQSQKETGFTNLELLRKAHNFICSQRKEWADESKEDLILLRLQLLEDHSGYEIYAMEN